jgi:predicted ATPase/class 3 adenylate cyclase
MRRRGVLDLPTGTVTFLFTDIEGSTRLLHELGDGYRAVQDRHAEIVRNALDAEDGREVRTVGDAFFAVFPTAKKAVRAAVRAQRELARSEWPKGISLRVRMGLHTGDGVLGGDDYIGVDVNRAARIAAAGHGGQVVMSDATRALVEQDLPDGVSLRYLGRHRLKDFEQQSLFDLVIDGQSAEFPALRSLGGTPPTNLPPPRTSFVGRERELAEVGALLLRARLVTLTGPGGTGKTRLALRVAAEHLDRFEDGAYLVDLSAMTDARLLLSGIAASVGAQEHPDTDLLDTLVRYLSDRTLLLVLDNVEQLVDAAPAVGRLIDAAPRLTVLATSRVPLHLAGEHDYLVQPLPLPDPATSALEALSACESVALFVERARAVRRGFELDDRNARAIAGIVERLDGLPLAIELAASRVNLLSPQAILDRLQQRLPLLEGGSRDGPERQQTLRGAIRWSFDLLNDEERRVFARISVFAGGFSLESAEAVCSQGLGVSVLDGLAALVDNSLVTRTETLDGRVRFRTLETIREYGRERLDESPEGEEVRRRHAWHFVAMAEAAEPELLTARSPWLDRLEEEHDNVRAALRWSIDSGEAEVGLRIVGALWRFWQVGNHLAEGRRWAEEVLRMPAAQERTAARAKALGADGSLAYFTSERARVRQSYEESLAIYGELGDRRGEADGAYNLAFAHLLAGELGPARELLERTIRIYGVLGDVVRQAHGKAALGLVCMQDGDLDASEALSESALATFGDAGDQWGLIWTLGQLASVALQREQYDRSRSFMLQSLDRSEAMGARGWNAVPVEGMGLLAIRQGDPDRGIRLAGAAARMKELAGGGAPPAIVGMQDPLQLVEGTMPRERIEELWSEGRALTSEEAIALARASE